MKEKIYICIIVLLLVFCFVTATNVYAKLSISVSKPSGGPNTTVDGDLAKVGQKVWSIARAVLQYAAIGIFIYAGVKYMIASADQKADVKKSMIPLFIGTLIVFGGTYVVDFIIKLFKDVAGI